MYYFIINPNSRSGKGALIWRDLENILRERNIKYQTFFTEYKGHAVLLPLLPRFRKIVKSS